MSENTEDLQYPIGRFKRPELVQSSDREGWIQAIEDLPQSLRACTQALQEHQFDACYRPGSWTVRQVIHHLADSHMNASIRFRLALTEDAPVVKPYLEAAWATLPDASSLDVRSSLDILSGLHERWVYLMRSMTDEQWMRSFVNPQYGDRPSSLHNTAALYAWHSKHHLAHVIRATAL